MARFDKGFIKRVRKYYPYDSYGSMIGASGVDTSAHTGNPSQQEIASVGITGLVMANGNMLNLWTPVPHDLNVLHPMGVRVCFQTASATAADTIDWIVLYDIFTMGAAVAMATGATALNTAIALLQTVAGVAQSPELTARGIINGATFTEAQVTGPAFVSWNVEMDGNVGIGEDMIYTGLLIDYMPKSHEGSSLTYNGDHDAY